MKLQIPCLQYFYLFLLGVLLFVLSLLVFNCFCNKTFFEHTIKKVSCIYHRDSLNNVICDHSPYSQITKKGLTSWDAGIFEAIAKNGYDLSEDGYLFAFFPLFPYTWRYLHLTSISVSVFNYLLFAISIILLIDVFFRHKTLREKIIIYSLSLVMPHTVTYNIPYAESLFLFWFAVSFWGLMNDKYWIYFAGMILFGMTRPAINVLLASFICVELYYLFLHRKPLVSAKLLFRLLLPLFIGTCFAILIQYQYSHNLFSFVLALKHWDRGFFIPTQITDWSEYGYSISIFCEAFIVLFAWGYLLLRVFRDFGHYKETRQELIEKKTNNKEVLIQRFSFYAIVYFIGVFLLNTFTQKGSINGLQRYIAASPFFYVFFYTYYEQIVSKTKTLKNNIIVVIMSLLGYAGLLLWNHRITFDDMGYFFFLACFLYFYLFNIMPRLLNYIYLIIIIMLCLVWKTYLFQAFIANAWIFT